MNKVALSILKQAGYSTSGVTLTPLTGGVSSDIYVARIGQEKVVIKSALQKLKVDDDWFADPTRILAEGEALTWFHSITPNYVPQPIAIVRSPPGIIIPYAPRPSKDWRASFAGKANNSRYSDSSNLARLACAMASHPSSFSYRHTT